MVQFSLPWMSFFTNINISKIFDSGYTDFLEKERFSNNRIYRRIWKISSYRRSTSRDAGRRKRKIQKTKFGFKNVYSFYCRTLISIVGKTVAHSLWLWILRKTTRWFRPKLPWIYQDRFHKSLSKLLVSNLEIPSKLILKRS